MKGFLPIGNNSNFDQLQEIKILLFFLTHLNEFRLEEITPNLSQSDSSVE